MIDGKAYHTNLSSQRIISAPYLNLVPAAPITECLSILMTLLYKCPQLYLFTFQGHSYKTQVEKLPIKIRFQ